ncbi:hypothetical protein RIF29_11845 [Crotalaria pallida]|uniref:Uncharacterized protein n=1 Tax=Crotalaria pallida TaxID=3830 RepID=A0AAN9IMI8_CROPI
MTSYLGCAVEERLRLCGGGAPAGRTVECLKETVKECRLERNREEGVERKEMRLEEVLSNTKKKELKGR